MIEGIIFMTKIVDKCYLKYNDTVVCLECTQDYISIPGANDY